MIQHLLLTRMNVVAPFGTPLACLDRDWLQHRFSLFERYTLPSVMAQTGAAPFQWLLFTHPDTPADFKARLARYAQRCPFIRMVSCAEFDGDSARQAAAAALEPETRRVITSRVDNDDAIGRTFMAAVQDEAARASQIRAASFINFDLGYHLHAGEVYHAEHRSNPFCSLVEERDGFRGVYGVSHMELTSLYPVANVRDRRRWLTVIHDRNAVNQVDGIRCRSAELAAEFDWLPAGEVVPYGWLAIQTRRATGAARRLVSRMKATTPPRIRPAGRDEKGQPE
jgi:hypothetical protein